MGLGWYNNSATKRDNNFMKFSLPLVSDTHAFESGVRDGSGRGPGTAMARVDGLWGHVDWMGSVPCGQRGSLVDDMWGSSDQSRGLHMRRNS